MEPNYTKTSLVPLEIMWCKLSNDTKNTQNRVWQAIQPSVKILELKQKNRMKTWIRDCQAKSQRPSFDHVCTKGWYEALIFSFLF